VVIQIDRVVEGCKNGSISAQEQMYKHFYAYAMSVCIPYAQSKFEAEEIVNDGFMKVFNKINSFDQKFPVKVWVRRIMINTAIDNYRSNKRHYNTMDIGEAYDVTNNDINVLEQMAVEDIMKLIQELSPVYRMVFSLATIEGYKHHEIAKMLKISEGTSKSNLFKAKAKLKGMILSKGNRG